MLRIGETLAEHCSREMASRLLSRDAVKAVNAMASAATEISALLAQGELAGFQGATVGRNSDGDPQKPLDLTTHEIVRAALKDASVSAFLSEESELVQTLDPAGTIAVAVDPLDGSGNVEHNISMGTIFSILPSHATGALGPFSGPCDNQLAAGFFLYGPQTTFALTLGNGVHIFTLDPARKVFHLTRGSVRVLEACSEYSINASNCRHWHPPVRNFVDDFLHSPKGVRGSAFNMRWHGALVAEAFRIVQRGGIYLYPGDNRPGYQHGRLRLLYEAAPVAFLVEQAGGMASTGTTRILDLIAESLHQRVPLIFGAADKVRRLERMHAEPDCERSPLFAERGLFRN